MGRVRPCQPRGARRKNFMARIAGVNIPTNKRVVIALTYIHGIGSTKAKEITEKLGIAPERRVQALTDTAVPIGRASCRESVCKSVLISVVAESLQQITR